MLHFPILPLYSGQWIVHGKSPDERILSSHLLSTIPTSMFANFVRGLRDKAPEAILEVRTNLGEARSHARTYHMPGDSFEPVR
jgi:hypothetical protein